MGQPGSRYRESPRNFPERLPPLEYSPGDVVRRVYECGRIRFHNRLFRVSKAFRGELLALRPKFTEGLWEVYFAQQRIARINLREAEPE